MNVDKLLSSFDSMTKKNILSYLDGDYDAKTKETLFELLKTNPEEVKNSFYTKLSFGTGGIRGKMGIGTNRMNEYTIRGATQGLANYLQKKSQGPFSVFIGYDSRKNSQFFAEQSAGVLAENSIKSYLFKTLCPTPIVSFGCREKKCSAAIMITASHNPFDYNGYKVYWNDGGQIIPPHDSGIIEEVNSISDPSKIKLAPSSHPLIERVEEEIFKSYLRRLKEIENYETVNKDFGKELSILYTPLHGTGITICKRALKGWGFSKVDLVDEQSTPDENFTNAPKPNPEEKKTLLLGIDQMLKKNADLLIATDPDADRMGVVINQRGKEFILSGNQIACILLHHILTALKNSKKLPKNSATVKSIVTSELFSEISKSFNISCFNVLTGFKYISEKMKLWDEDGSYKFIFGAEESLGFLREDFVRDKDGISSSCLICEAALKAKKDKKTLVDILYEIYQKYGVYREDLISLSFAEGKEGMNQMNSLMSSLREFPPKEIANYQLFSFEDYKTGKSFDFQKKEKKSLLLPSSDVLLFSLSDGSKIVIRPSGTEPKLKIYIGVREKNIKDLNETIKLCDERIKALSSAIEKIISR